MKNLGTRRSVALLLAIALVPGSSWGQQSFVLPDGTPVRLRLNRNLSSADAKLGEQVDFDVLEEVTLNGLVIVQRGSTALATVTEAESKRRMGRAGKLNVSIDYVRTVLGDKIALRAVKENSGGSNAGKMTGAIVATSIVFFPAAPLFLFMKGKDITIPKGTEISAYVQGDIRLDEPRFRAHSANARGSGAPSEAGSASGAGNATLVTSSSAAPVAGKALTNEDVLALSKAGFSDEVIISKISSAQCAFRLETADMIELRNTGLSDKVIASMVEKAK